MPNEDALLSKGYIGSDLKIPKPVYTLVYTEKSLNETFSSYTLRAPCPLSFERRGGLPG